MLIFIPNPGGALQLEDGLGDLLLENGDTLSLESSVAEYAVQVEDETPVLSIPYVYKHESFFFQPGDPDEATEPRYYEAWQNQSTTTPVIYQLQHRFGNYYAMEYFFMQLSPPVFSPDGTGVLEPVEAVLLTEGKGDLTIVGTAS